MNFSILFLCVTFTSFTLGIQILNDNNKKYCFQFTWPGSLIGENDINKINCTVLGAIGIPCMDTIEITDSPPNLTEIWLNKDKTKSHICHLTRGYSCIRYTYNFDDAITNVTYFCGKMIKNKETAIQEGCFSQKLGGYDVETCACQSTGFGNGMPCNSSIKLIYSFVVLVSVLLLLSLI